MARASSTSWQRPSVTTLDLPKPKGAYFDEAAADRAVEFFRLLPHIKGRWAGQPFVLLPWEEEEIIRPLFGWMRKDGTRLYRECYVRIARKNGKSTIAAGVAGKLTYADREPGAEVYSAAVDKDQARIVFGALSEMVRSSPELDARSKVMRNAIEVGKTHSYYKVLSADAPNKHGLNAHGVIVDELHAHPSRDLFDVLSTSTGAREQPLVFSITTAGVYDPEGICVEKDEYTRKVATGQLKDPAFLGLIYELEEGDDWRDEKNWIKANPGIGETVSLEYLRRERDKAEASVAAQNTFRMLHCNQWVQQSVRWLDLARWDENAGESYLPLAEEASGDFDGKICYGGLDLSAVSDLTALVWLFPEDDVAKVLGRFWVPEAALDVGKPNAALYRQWASDGWLRTTSGEAVDYKAIRRQVNEDASRFYVAGLNMDVQFQGYQLEQELREEDGLPVESFQQGYNRYSAPMKEFERRVLERQFAHGGNPVLRWAIDNIVVLMNPDGFIKPDRKKSKGKIDPGVAAIMATDFLAQEQHGGEPQIAVF